MMMFYSFLMMMKYFYHISLFFIISFGIGFELGFGMVGLGFLYYYLPHRSVPPLRRARTLPAPRLPAGFTFPVLPLRTFAIPFQFVPATTFTPPTCSSCCLHLLCYLCAALHCLHHARSRRCTVDSTTTACWFAFVCTRGSLRVYYVPATTCLAARSLRFTVLRAPLFAAVYVFAIPAVTLPVRSFAVLPATAAVYCAMRARRGGIFFFSTYYHHHRVRYRIVLRRPTFPSFALSSFRSLPPFPVRSSFSSSCICSFGSVQFFYHVQFYHLRYAILRC